MPVAPTPSAVVAANGTAVISVRPHATRKWEITQVSTEMRGAPAGSACTLRRNGRFITRMISTGDVADGVPSIPLGPGDVLTVEWEACTPGLIGNATAFYEEAG